MTTSSEKPQQLDPSSSSPIVLVVHGGAGLEKGTLPYAPLEQYRIALREALLAGYRVLEAGGEALDAAVTTVTVLEDCPLFNAGKGAVFNVKGKNELEASVMVSKPLKSHSHIPATRRGIGLTLLTHTRNPSHLARQLYLAPNLAPHAFLSGDAAEKLSEEPPVDPSYFFTPFRWKEHRRGLGLPEEPLPLGHQHDNEEQTNLDLYPKGTVGAVALDINGCLASVTSTGGKTNKSVGRIGDTPSMGAGYWAEEWNTDLNKSWLQQTINRFLGMPSLGGVGISGTGDGDYFIRQNSAVTIAHRMKFLGETVGTACQNVIDELAQNGGEGGVIAIDREGDVALCLNSGGMYRGVITRGAAPKVAIFADDVLE